jgi:predicted AAA+ superfamily ATPase
MYPAPKMLTISERDIFKRIRTENPWWLKGHGVSVTHLEFIPRPYLTLFLPLIQSSVRRAVVLMGPRRVGKTVMIHHAIQQLIDDGVKPESICYFSVDNPIYNGLSLDKLLGYYSKIKGLNHKTERLYVFFDEIQYLRKWEVRLKSSESGAGRFTDFLLPPLTFYEYLHLREKTVLLKAPPIAIAKERAEYFLTENIEQVNELFVYYLNFGGYPEVIFSPEIQSDPSRFIKSDIIDKVLLRDLPSLYGIADIQELNYLFTTLAFNTANEISLGELSQNSGVAKNTIKRYIDYLEAAFLIKVVHRVDRNAKRFDRANYFKVYLTNPSMRAALFSPLNSDDAAITSLAETAIYSQWFHSDTPLYYARWHGGEVDIVHLGPKQKPLWAVEVKWSDRYCERPRELESIVAFCQSTGLKDILVTSKTQNVSCKVDDLVIPFVPSSVYCYTVGYNIIHGRMNLPLTEQLEIENRVDPVAAAQLDLPVAIAD